MSANRVTHSLAAVQDDLLYSLISTDRVGRQELEIVIGDEHISFTTSKIGSLVSPGFELLTFLVHPFLLLHGLFFLYHHFLPLEEWDTASDLSDYWEQGFPS